MAIPEIPSRLSMRKACVEDIEALDPSISGSFCCFGMLTHCLDLEKYSVETRCDPAMPFENLQSRYVDISVLKLKLKLNRYR